VTPAAVDGAGALPSSECAARLRLVLAEGLDPERTGPWKDWTLVAEGLDPGEC